MAETPKFWKGIQIFGVLLGTIAASLMASELEFSTDTAEFLKYLLTIGGTLAAVGQFAITDNGKIEPKKD